MNLIRFCVEKKVTVAMFTVTIFVFGMISWFRLDREFMPELQFPQLVILTNYPNASSQEVENLVTKNVEEAAGTVKNVHRIHSSSREGIAIVTVEFLWGTNMDIASLNLREKVDLAKAKLPRDCGEPRIEKFNPFALPVVSLSLSGSLSDKDLLALARRPVAELLEKTRGVAAVSIAGGQEREIQVELDQSRLTARNLPILDVGQAIARTNVTYPAGTVKDQTFEYVVRVLGAFKSVSEMGNVAVAIDRTRLSSGLNPEQARRYKQQDLSARQSPQIITLDSLAEIKDSVAETTSYSRYDGKANISLSILKQAEANIVRAAEAVKEQLPNVRSKLPAGVSLEVVYDQSTFIQSGIRSMVCDSLMGGILAFGVLFLFLGNWRDAVVVSMAIPVSILTTFFIMDSKGMTLNTISLAGLAIGIGKLVDGAIVVQENIARHRDMGKSVTEAAVHGASEVFSAVIGSVLTTVAVFLPLIFVVGIIGQVFKDLSLAVVFSQMVSLVVAFTLVPMLASKLSRKQEGSPQIIEKIQSKTSKWAAYYDRLLDYALLHPGRVVLTASVACGISILILMYMPRAVFPQVEGDQIFMRLDMPMGTRLDVTNQISKKIEDAAAGIKPEIEHQSVTVGSLSQEGLQPLGNHQAQIVLNLHEDRKKTTAEITGLLKEKLKNVDLQGGQLYFFEQGGTFSFLGGQGAPIVVELKGHDLAKLETLSDQLLAKFKEVRGLHNVRSSLSEPAPELQLDIQRDRLADLSLSVSDLSETVLAGLRGKVVSKFHDQGKEIDIRVRLRSEDRENIASVEQLYVHSPLDINVPVHDVASVRLDQGPSEIIRYDQQRTILVSADLTGRSVADAGKEIEKILAALKKEENITMTLTGESARMSESFISLQVVLALSILFVFMIMAAEFESLWQPLLILLTIPLALIGMVLGLLAAGQPLTAMAGMGLVFLGGIVVDNGIILIDFVNQQTEKGMPLKEALKAGCHTRLRPILMTAICTILGMLPLAFGIGEGADMQQPMAVVMVSGLLVSTLLTLVEIPALFVLFEEKIFLRQGKRDKKQEARKQEVKKSAPASLLPAS